VFLRKKVEELSPQPPRLSRFFWATNWQKFSLKKNCLGGQPERFTSTAPNSAQTRARNAHQPGDSPDSPDTAFALILQRKSKECRTGRCPFIAALISAKNFCLACGASSPTDRYKRWASASRSVNTGVRARESRPSCRPLDPSQTRRPTQLSDTVPLGSLETAP
jgi:hypothetical protein